MLHNNYRLLIYDIDALIVLLFKQIIIKLHVYWVTVVIYVTYYCSLWL